MNIAAIMPCRGRHEQTVVNIRRLLATAHYDVWRLIAVGGRDEGVLLDSLESFGVEVVRSDAPRVTYWQALKGATERSDATHLVNLANDLLPGMHWLKRAVEAYKQEFGSGPGLMGFNGDSHEVGHSCHFLIDRTLLDLYGGWPIWYDHTYGDTELCQRAIGDGLYAKAPWALLYHNHPYWGGQDDQVYAEGRAQVDRDYQLFEQRRRRGWPALDAPKRISKRAKAIAWLQAAPRTPRQIAQLLGISQAHAATLIWQLRQLGKVEPIGPLRTNQENRYRLT